MTGQEITAASVDQIVKAKDGHWLTVDADVGSVTRQLAEIDPCLKVRLNEHARVWAIFHRHPVEGGYQDDLVTTCQAHQSRTGVWLGLDQRIVDRIRRVADPGYDFVAELDRENARADRAAAHRKAEQTGDIVERAWSAVNRDLGTTHRIVVPRSINGG